MIFWYRYIPGNVSMSHIVSSHSLGAPAFSILLVLRGFDGAPLGPFLRLLGAARCLSSGGRHQSLQWPQHALPLLGQDLAPLRDTDRRQTSAPPPPCLRRALVRSHLFIHRSRLVLRFRDNPSVALRLLGFIHRLGLVLCVDLLDLALLRFFWSRRLLRWETFLLWICKSSSSDQISTFYSIIQTYNNNFKHFTSVMDLWILSRNYSKQDIRMHRETFGCTERHSDAPWDIRMHRAILGCTTWHSDATRDIRMHHVTFGRTTWHSDAPRDIRMHRVTFGCSTWHLGEPRDIRMYHMTFGGTTRYSDAPRDIRMHHVTFGCTTWYSDAPRDIRTHHVTFGRTTWYSDAPRDIRMHHVIWKQSKRKK